MKKRIIAMLMALVFMMSTLTALAYSAQEKTADALNELDLFRGKGAAGYDLNANLTRAEGATLLVRVLGKDDVAQNWPISDIPFKDVPAWAIGYVGYAAANGITNGTSPTTFSPNDTLSDFMFLTLVLRTLGYTDQADQGAEPQFVWNNPYALAQQVGLIAKAEADQSFTRGDAVEILWNAMGIQLVGGNKTLADSLIEQQVFTKAEFKKAADIQKNGRKESAGTPIVRPEDNTGNAGNQNPTTPPSGGNAGTTTPTTPETPVTPEKPVTPPAQEDDGKMTYAKYSAMSGAEQQAYFNTFKDPMAFFAWYNAAKAEYEANQDRIEIGEGDIIDLDKIINGQ